MLLWNTSMAKNDGRRVIGRWYGYETYKPFAAQHGNFGSVNTETSNLTLTSKPPMFPHSKVVGTVLLFAGTVVLSPDDRK